MSKNKLEKPENIADSKTYKVMPLIEPPLEGGDIFIDGEPIEEVIKANLILKTNDDGKVTGLDVDRLETMTNSDGSVTFYADKLYEINPQTGEKVEITPRMIVRNGDDVVAVDDYVNEKYLYKK